MFMIYLGDVKQSVDIINRNIRNSNQFEIFETEGRHPIFAAHKKGTNAQPTAPRPDDDARAALFQHFCKEQELTEWLRSHRRTRATDKLARPK
ncbi:hypothetical protein QOU69_28545 [Burkholderia pseudomallei]|uniref:hypothetical protein n=1 Tax=Burkholderia pseudomallei TaxID=28450 RepID=UPI001E2B3C86|nr:hypothetical protein [Burkholderia pseudomallei]MCW0013525.1 hypothetical protein [Burkholderia pseudomallei]MDK2570669.1 hypothetical protein [Burkholderia pseudomallei]